MAAPVPLAAPDPVAERARALASSVRPADGKTQAASELARIADRDSLERARQYLVWSIQQQSDDYEATAALTLVNQALAQLGWEDPYPWKLRRKP